MIQRIQSVFLFIAALISGVLSNVLDLWKSGTEWFQANDYAGIYGLFLASAALSLISILLFKNRKRQVTINIFNIFLNIALVGLLVYHLLNLPGDAAASEKGIGLFIPIISVIFLWLANRSIIKDDKLVKSVDRFR